MALSIRESAFAIFTAIDFNDNFGSQRVVSCVPANLFLFTYMISTFASSKSDSCKPPTGTVTLFAKAK